MSLDLNSTNINIILNNISCCIDKLSKDILLYAQIGNKKCLEETNEKILVLNEIYNILKANYQISYPIYQVNVPDIIQPS